MSRLLTASMLFGATIAAVPQTAHAAPGDFNGDGFDDLVVAVPFEDVAAVDAGGVHVILGSATGPTSTGNKFWHQNVVPADDGAEAGDRFGSAIAWGDFDGDGFDDLVIGIDGEDIGAVVDAGAVYVLYGTGLGLVGSGSQFWHQNSTGLLDTSETGDGFGAALAVGDFDGDGFDDLAIGVPGEEVNTMLGAGAVQVLYGSASGLAASGNQFWHQDSLGILETAENSDNFGDALAAGDFDGDGRDDLVVGVEDEDVDTVNEAGVVHIIYGSVSGVASAGNQVWNQDSVGINEDVEHLDHLGDSVATGDFNGDGFDDLAMSVELEDIGAVVDAGAVHVLFGSATGVVGAGSQFWHQNVTGVTDVAEAGDRFGSSLACGDFNGDGFAELAIGVEDEAIGAVLNAGGTHVLFGSAAGPTEAGDRLWSQNTAGILDVAESGDHFGDEVATGDFNGDGWFDLVIGVENESVGTVLNAGALNLFYGSGVGLSATGDRLIHQNSAGIKDISETDDHFGSEL